MLVSSYISPKAVKGRPSAIQGRGLVAVAPISKDEIVAIKGTPGTFGTATKVSIDRPRRRGTPALGDMVAMLRAGLEAPESDIIPWS